MSSITTYIHLNQTHHSILLVGYDGVGKSSLVERFAYNQFNPIYKPNSALEQHLVTFDLTNQTLNLLDPVKCGRCLCTDCTAYLRYSDGILLVFNLQNNSSFRGIMTLGNMILGSSLSCSRVPLILVGNQADLPNPQVSQSQIDKLATSWDVEYVETSAANNINVQEVFQKMIQKIEEQKKANLTFNSNNFCFSSPRDVNLTVNKRNGDESGQNREKDTCTRNCAVM